MEPDEKIDIKSEIYRAVVPHVTRHTKAALGRYRELPKLDVLKNYLLMYFAVGFILEGFAGALPSMVLAVLGLSPNIVGVAFFLFWPVIIWSFLSAEHAILSIGILFIGATYMSHYKLRAVEATAALQATHPQAALADHRVPVQQIEADSNYTENAEILPPDHEETVIMRGFQKR